MTQQYPTDKERLVKIEMLLAGLSDGMTRLENLFQGHINESKRREEAIDARIDQLAHAEGSRDTALKRRIIELVLFTGVGSALTYLATAIAKIAGS